SIDAMVGLPAGPPVEAWEWDIAPADLIVREAGGAATDLDGAPLRYNRAEPRFGSGLIIAADAALHRRLLAALRPPRSAAPRAARSAGDGGPAVGGDGAALHHEVDAGGLQQQLDVVEGIAVDGDEVGEAAGLHRPQLALEAQALRGPLGRRPQRLHRREA